MPLFKTINSLDDLPSFNIVKEPLFKQSGIQIPNLFSIQRSDNGNHLGTCTKKYRPIQMDEMIDTLQEACSRVDHDIQHIGFTESTTGSKVVIKSYIGDVGFDDEEIEGYFYTIIDNSGLNANRLIPSTLRLFCDNQLHLIKRIAKGAERAPSLRHNYSFDQRVEMYKLNISAGIERARNFASIAKHLKSQKFTEKKMRELVEFLFPVTDDESEKKVLKREAIVSLFSNGIATGGSTKWDALNAITQYESHQKFTPAKFIRTITMPTISTKAYEFLDAA